LLTAKSASLARCRLIRRDARLSTANQTSSRPKQSYRRENKVIYADSSLSPAKQSHSPQNGLVYRKVDLSAAKSTDIAVDKLIRLVADKGRDAEENGHNPPADKSDAQEVMANPKMKCLASEG
jgi:hypothetical protein